MDKMFVDHKSQNVKIVPYQYGVRRIYYKNLIVANWIKKLDKIENRFESLLYEILFIINLKF